MMRWYQWNVISQALFIACLALMLSKQATADEEDLVQTDTGSPLKVVVRRDSAIYEGPKKEGKNRPVSMFEFFYVLKPEDGSSAYTKDDFYRIASGESKKQEVGWINKDDVVEWSHRQALGIRPVGGRDQASFYKSKDDLSSAYGSAGGAATPLSREPKGGTLDINLVPILDRFTMKADGDDVDGYHVAYLHSRSGKRAGGGSVSGEPAIDLSKATLDVVFVIDTTASMQPHIDATKEAVSRIAREIAKGSKDAKVRFGLVGYRDVISDPGAGWYVTKLYSDLETGADHEQFQKILSTVREAEQSSEDTPEDVFAGLKVARTQAKWNPNAFKQIILMGDAPAQSGSSGAKNQDKLTIDGVVALMQPRGIATIQEQIAVHAIHCYQSVPDMLAVEHFRALAEGEGFKGFYREFDTSRGPAFVDELVSITLKSLEGLVKAKSGDVIPKDTPGLGLLLEMVNASEASTGDDPSFASGYCCEIDGKGNQVFEPYVLVQNGRVGMFNSFVEFSVRALRTSGDPGSRDVARVLQSVQIFATQINLGEPITADIPLSKIATYILGFPVRSKIFDMTFAKLAAMSEADFESWVKQVEASKTITQSHLDNPRIWRALDGRSDAPLEQRYCFLKVKDLP